MQKCYVFRFYVEKSFCLRKWWGPGAPPCRPPFSTALQKQGIFSDLKIERQYERQQMKGSMKLPQIIELLNSSRRFF